MSCYDAVCVGRAVFGLFSGTEEGLSPSLPLLPPVFGGTRSLCYLPLVDLVTEELEKLFYWN